MKSRLPLNISSVCRSGFFQLRQLRTIRRSLTTDATRALVKAFVSCRLDYCNSLLAGVADVHIRRLQLLQNAVARLVAGARRCDHISPVLAELHWLPIRQRITFKTAVLVWKCLRQSAALPCRSMHSGHFSRGKASTTFCNDWNPSLAKSSDFHWPAELRGVRPRNLEQSTSFATCPRTVAEHLQTPAEVSAFPARVNHCRAPLWLNSEFGVAYNYPDSTQPTQLTYSPVK